MNKHAWMEWTLTLKLQEMKFTCRYKHMTHDSVVTHSRGQVVIFLMMTWWWIPNMLFFLIGFDLSLYLQTGKEKKNTLQYISWQHHGNIHTQSATICCTYTHMLCNLSSFNMGQEAVWEWSMCLWKLVIAPCIVKHFELSNDRGALYVSKWQFSPFIDKSSPLMSLYHPVHI